MENIDMVAKQVSDSVAMVVSMLDDFESKISLPLPTGTSVHVRDIFKGNLLDFMMHMASIDGEPDWDACFLIGKCMGGGGVPTPAMIKELLAGRMEREAYFKKMPEIMVICKVFDYIIQMNPSNSRQAKTGEAVIQLYEIIGSCLIKSDDNVTSNEFRMLNTYLEMMRGYETYEPNKSQANSNTSVAAETVTMTAAVPEATGETIKTTR